MANIENSNLYPPVIETYMPAFLVDSNYCRVYFSISSFNSLPEINTEAVQVTVTNQNNSVSVLNRTTYPNEIKVTSLKIDSTRVTTDKYYIELKASDLEPEYGYNEETGEYETSKFNINQYYKVQIRFTAAGVDTPDIQGLDSWLYQNQSQFSEWSTVCLIRGISTPILTLKGLEIEADTNIWSQSDVDIIGTLSFADAAETETLYSYEIKLFDSTGALVLESGDLYSNSYSNINEINYTLKYTLQSGEDYSLQLKYVTKSQYSQTITYNLQVETGTADVLDATISGLEEPENGRLGINILGTAADFTGTITIRRASSRTNFTVWEDIHTFTIANEPLNYTWYDYTVESGVWYKYYAQRRDSSGGRGVALELDTALMVLLDDIFLNADGKQLCIRFNPKVNSFKRTISEGKTETLGSKYPFVTRNGYMNYKQFPLEGTITYFMNKDEIFVSEDEIYGNEELASLYKDFNKIKKIPRERDIILEKEFRDKVMNFLYENNVKLFRSPTEGNMLIKLMEINFTPEAALGRRIYSFSCTAVEMDDFTIENCLYHNVISTGEAEMILQFQTEYLGQLQQDFTAGAEVMNILEDKYADYAKEGYEIQIDYISSLRIEMNSDPCYIIEESSNVFTITEDAAAADYTGWLVYVNDTPIIINSTNNVYSQQGDNIKVESIVFGADCNAIIDYNILISQKQSEEVAVMSVSYFRDLGQYSDSCNSNESIYKIIYNKHSTDGVKLLYLDSVKIEGEPGTVVYIKDLTEETKYIVGSTGTLEISGDSVTIYDLYFTGIHFLPAAADETLIDNIYAISETTYSDLDSISPSENTVYTLTSGDQYIKYQGAWWKFENEEITCPVYVTIDYTYEYMRGVS